MAGIFFKFSTFFLHFCLCFSYFHGLKHWNKFCAQDYSDSMNSWLFLRCGLHGSCFESIRILIDSSALTIHACFVLCCPTVQQVSLCLWSWSLQSIAAGIGISNFLRAFFIKCLNSSSSGTLKKIPRNLLALSWCGFSIAHLHVFPIIWPHIVRSGGRLFSCQSLPGPCISIRLFFIQTVNLVKPVHESDRFRFPSIFQ